MRWFKMRIDIGWRGKNQVRYFKSLSLHYLYALHIDTQSELGWRMEDHHLNPYGRKVKKASWLTNSMYEPLGFFPHFPFSLLSNLDSSACVALRRPASSASVGVIEAVLDSSSSDESFSTSELSSPLSSSPSLSSLDEADSSSLSISIL